jgi:hypothetical protein
MSSGSPGLTGGMQRTHLWGHPNILTRLLIHLAGFNPAMVTRGVGDRQASARARRALAVLLGLLNSIQAAPGSFWRPLGRFRRLPPVPEPQITPAPRREGYAGSIDFFNGLLGCDRGGKEFSSKRAESYFVLTLCQEGSYEALTRKCRIFSIFVVMNCPHPTPSK